MDEQVTPVTDQNVRKPPKGFWAFERGYSKLGKGGYYPILPRTLLDVIGVVQEWHA